MITFDAQKEDERRLRGQREAWRDQAVILSNALNEALPFGRQVVLSVEDWLRALDADPLAAAHCGAHEAKLQAGWIEFRKALVGSVFLPYRYRCFPFPSKTEKPLFFSRYGDEYLTPVALTYFSSEGGDHASG